MEGFWAMMARFWTLMRPLSPGDFWACVAALAAIGVLVIAWKGLRSIDLTRRTIDLAHKDMTTRAKRDARNCAVLRAEEWALQLLPLNAEILTQLAAHKIRVFVEGSRPDDALFGEDEARHRIPGRKWIDGLPQGLYFEMIGFLNRVESWSMHFTHGLADERVAAGPCAPTFCSIVVQLYPVLVVQRAKASSGRYPNIVKLYRCWAERMDLDAKGEKERKLRDELGKLQAEGPGASSALEPPLGLDEN